MKFLIALTFFFSVSSWAHPVIYQGGFALSSYNMPDYSNNYLMYSVTSKTSLGLEQWRFTQDEDNNQSYLLKLNHLLWRNNGHDSQANLYLHSGIGVEDKQWPTKTTQANFLLGLEGDWETRDLYASMKFYQFRDTNLSQGRVGFAPYRAGFKELQTWFMLQLMHIDDYQETVMVTPMLRFFYQNVLWEVGSSVKGEWMLNFMVHY